MSQTRYLHPEVRDKMENPRDGEEVALVVVSAGGDADELVEVVGECSGEIRRELEFGMLVIDIPEPSIQQLWSHDAVQALQPEGEKLEVL